MFTVIILVTVITAIVSSIALCRISGDCSRQEELKEWEDKEREKARVLAQYCDDLCIRCENEDYCPFSEMQ